MYKVSTPRKDSLQTLENDQEEGNVKKLQEHIRLMSDERKCVIALILVLFMGLLLVYTYAGDGCRNDHEGILRLHVIANSNKVGDQALKLKVRDAVIEYMADQKDLKTVDETREYLKENKKRLQRIAEGVIAAQGYDYPAAVELGVRYIPQKTYGDITFPAGNYEALNITIGSGQGENWWCVLFPPLCLWTRGRLLFQVMMRILILQRLLRTVQVLTRVPEIPEPPELTAPDSLVCRTASLLVPPSRATR